MTYLSVANFLLGIALWNQATPGTAAEYVDKQGAATLHIRAGKVDAAQLEIRLSDLLPVTFSMVGTAALEVQSFRTVTTSPDWELGHVSSAERTILPSGQVRWQQTVKLKPVKAGECTLPLAPLHYRENSDESWRERPWKPISVRVTTEIANLDLSELRDSTPPEELPPEPSLRLPLVRVGLAAGLLVLLWSGWQYYRRRMHRPASTSSHQWALEELDRIEKLPLATENDSERYHTELSDVVRRYLELRFQLPALEQTTAEFFAAIERSELLTGEQQLALRELMQRWDLVKFAQVHPTVEECHALGGRARQFVERTRTGASEAKSFSGEGHHGRRLGR